MEKATTALSPREAMVRLARAWKPLFGDINAHYRVDSKSKVILDERIAEEMRIFSSLERKLNDSFLQQLLHDAKLIGEEAKKNRDYKTAENLLREVEALLMSIKRDELIRKKQASYLKRLAAHLGGNVRKIEREVEREVKKQKKPAVSKQLRLPLK